MQGQVAADTSTTATKITPTPKDQRERIRTAHDAMRECISAVILFDATTRDQETLAATHPPEQTSVEVLDPQPSGAT